MFAAASTLAAIPLTAHFQDMVLAEYPDQTRRPMKPMKTISRSQGQRRYLALFEELGAALPIVRVIVGPSTDQVAKIAWERELCGNVIPIVASKTPFKG